MIMPLHMTTPAFTQADHSPLNVTSATSIFYEVHDSQKGIKCDITLYPL